MKTLKQIWDAGNTHYKTPICGSRLYQESEIREWLTQKRRELPWSQDKNNIYREQGRNNLLNELIEELNQ